MKSKLYSLLLLAGVLYSTAAYMQPVIKKQRDFGGFSEDYLTSLAPTSDGGLIAAGYSKSQISGDKTETRRGMADYWVVKLDDSLNLQWDKTIGGTGWDELHYVQQT